MLMFFGERIMMLSWRWFATVDDTDSVQPLKQTHGFSLWSSAYRWCRCFLDTSGRVLAVVAAVIVCQRLHVVRLWFAVGGLYIWRVRLLGCALWKQFSRS